VKLRQQSKCDPLPGRASEKSPMPGGNSKGSFLCHFNKYLIKRVTEKEMPLLQEH